MCKCSKICQNTKNNGRHQSWTGFQVSIWHEVFLFLFLFHPSLSPTTITLQPFSPLYTLGWPPASHSSFLHFSCSCASSLFKPHSLMSLSYWLHDSTSSLAFLSRLPPHMTCFSSPSHRRLSVTHCPSHLNRLCCHPFFRFKFSSTKASSAPSFVVSTKLNTK